MNIKIPLEEHAAGDEIPALVLEPLTRHTLALYCGGSGDHNPIHTDFDYAKRSGLPDVIGHGMLTLAYVARMLTDFAGPSAVRKLGVRFVSMAQIGDVIRCSGKVMRRGMEDGEDRLFLSLVATVGDRQLVVGDAVVATTARR